MLYERGYNATGVKDIVDAAGVPKGSFYTYFPSKEEFTVKAIEYYSAQADGGPLEDKSLAPLERVRTFFDQIIEALTSMGMKQGCLIGNMCQEMADHNDAIRAVTENCFAKQQKLLSACLLEAREQGDLAPGSDPDKLAAFIFNSWQGYLLRMKAARDARIFDEFRGILFNVVLV